MTGVPLSQPAAKEPVYLFFPHGLKEVGAEMANAGPGSTTGRWAWAAGLGSAVASAWPSAHCPAVTVVVPRALLPQVAVEESLSACHLLF